MMEQNPYAAPTAPVQDNPAIPEGRPWQVWVIFIFIMFGAVSNAGFLVMLANGRFPMTPESAAYFSGFGTAEYLFSSASIVIYVAAAVALLRMRRVALPLMVTHVVLGLGFIAYQFTRPGYAEMMGHAGGYVGMAVGELITVSIAVYTYKLFRSGRLQ
jgi:hypothetical protein